MPVVMGFVIDAVGLSLGATLFAAVLASIAALGGALVFRKLARD